MRSGFALATLGLSLFAVGCRTTQHGTSDSTARKLSSQTVEAGCATCVFDMKDVTGCKLAVKIDGKAYLVTGSDIDDHGDAHAEDGLCNTRRKAEVTGRIDGDRFAVTKMALLPK